MSGARILFVDQSGSAGGAELCLADIAAHFSNRSRVALLSDGPFAGVLRARGVDVTVLRESERVASVRKRSGALDFLRAASGVPSGIMALRREARDAEILYLNTPKALVLGVPAAMATRKKIVFHLHDFLDARHFSAGNVRLLVACANRCHLVIANSRAVESAFRKAGGRARCEVVPNGFDPSLFDTTESGGAARLRKEYNPEGAPVVGIFGRISRWKGQDILLRAAADVPGLLVWVAGEPLFTDDDRAFSMELRRMASTSSLHGRVRFLGQREDVPLLMKAADIVAHASTAPEPFGRVVVEGMLAGKPVVAADAGGPTEIIEHGITGWLFPAGNHVALAMRLRQILSDPDAAAEAGRRAARAARERFALPQVLEKTRALLDSLGDA